VRTVRSATGLLLSLGLATAVTGCRRAAPAEAADVPIVAVATVETDTIRDTVAAPGTVVPAPGAEFMAVAPQPSRLLEIPKGESAHVEAGDLLARFEPLATAGDAAVQNADLAAARAELETARTELAHQKALFDQGYTPRNTYEAAQRVVDRAQAKVDSIDAQKKAFAVLNDRSSIRAPFAGIVSRVWHVVGDAVSPSPTDPILRLVDPTRTQVAVQMSPTAFMRVTMNQPVTFTLDSGELRQGKVTMVPLARRDPDASAPVEVRMSVDGDALPLDSVVKTEILINQRANATVAPVAALVRQLDETYVMLAGADGRAHRRDVKVGLISGTRAEILDGLTAGDEVIVSGLETVTDNGPIAVARGR
jgi:RND family efflux transporter MFP subunit